MSSHCRREFLKSFVGLAATAAVRPLRALADAPEWIDRRSYGPFQVSAAFALDELDRDLADLGTLQAELQRTLAVIPARQTVDVYLAADERAHRSLLRSQFPQAPYRRAIYVQSGGRGAIYGYKHRELPVDLRHECTHALLHADLPSVPLWLDEGLAEYFEAPGPERAFDSPHLRALRWNFRIGMMQTVASLEDRRTRADMGPAEYRFAWAWVHFMLHGPVAAHRALVAYLADVRAGNTPGPFSQRLLAAMPDANDQLVRHFKHWRQA